MSRRRRGPGPGGCPQQPPGPGAPSARQRPRRPARPSGGSERRCEGEAGRTRCDTFFSCFTVSDSVLTQLNYENKENILSKHGFCSLGWPRVPAGAPPPPKDAGLGPPHLPGGPRAPPAGSQLSGPRRSRTRRPSGAALSLRGGRPPPSPAPQGLRWARGSQDTGRGAEVGGSQRRPPPRGRAGQGRPRRSRSAALHAADPRSRAEPAFGVPRRSGPRSCQGSRALGLRGREGRSAGLALARAGRVRPPCPPCPPRRA